MPRPEGTRPAIFAGLTLALGSVLLWPAFVNGGPLLFFDSPVYLDQGRQAVEGALDLLAPPADQGAGNAAGNEAGAAGDGARFATRAASATFIRSLAWSGFAYVGASSPLGLYGPVLVQSLLAALLILMLVMPSAGRRLPSLLAGLATLALLTSLPWFASLLMPDILAGLLILAAMLLVQDSGFGAERVPHLMVVALAAAFAVGSHYGHLPLGIAVLGGALLALVVQRRLSAALTLAAILPLLLAAGANMLASTVAFDTPDVAPKRLPILLARSIEDGPARWYLADVCPEAGYVLCRHMDQLPDSVGDMLWGPDSLLRRLSDAEIDAVRAEETAILIGAFRAYPREQLQSVVGNAAGQLVAIGMDDIRWGRARVGEDGRWQAAFSDSPDRTLLEVAAAVQVAVLILALAAIGLFAARDGLKARPDERALLFVLLVGLLANAAIFGGLSAPVDRYQARIIWLVPLLALLFALNRHRPADRE